MHGARRADDPAGAHAAQMATQPCLLPKLPGKQRPIGSVERSAAFENVLVFNHGHFAAAGVEKSSTTAKVGV